MYIADCGEQEPSPFTLHREGYIHYGSEPYKRIDYDTGYLEYRFTHLDSSRIYKMSAYLYQESSANIALEIEVDGYQITTLHLPPDTLLTTDHLVPRQLYKDGQIRIKILGTRAVSGLLVLSAFEEENKGGGPQDYGTKGLTAGELKFNIYPNPVTQVTAIKYNIPHEDVVEISVYDAAGRLVRELVNRVHQSGSYVINLDTNALTQGVYFVKLGLSNQSVVQKVVLVR